MSLFESLSRETGLIVAVSITTFAKFVEMMKATSSSANLRIPPVGPDLISRKVMLWSAENQTSAGMDTYPIGIVGTMPGAEIPWALVALWSALEAGDMKRAAEIHAPIAKMVSYQTTLDSYVAVEKYLLVKQGVFTNTRQRGPVSFILDKTVTDVIDAAYAELEALVKP